MLYRVMKRCMNMVEDVDFLYEEVEKNNGVYKEAIRMRKKGSNVSAVVYMDTLESVFGDHLTLDNACQYIIDVARTELDVKVSIKDLNTWEHMKERIRKKVVNYEKNKNRLENMVYRRYHDLAEVCYMLVDVDESVGCAEIQKQIVTDFWNVTEEEVFEMAEKNMEMEGYEVRSLYQVLGADAEEIPEIPTLYMITNNMAEFGAGILANPKLFHELMKDLKGNFYIFPSSVHELVAKAATIEDTLEAMQSMVKEINESCVSDKDFLSNNVYYYNASTGEIILCE